MSELCGLDQEFGIVGITDYSDDVINDYEVCSCCGTRARKLKSTVDIKLSNYINVKAVRSESWKNDTGIREIVCIETRNGPLTIGMRYEW